MAKIKLKGFIHRDKYSGAFVFYGCDMTEYGGLMVCPFEREFDVEIPADWNPVAAEVSMLNKKLDEISDEHMKQVKAIKGRIAELLCIENSPTAEA